MGNTSSDEAPPPPPPSGGAGGAAANNDQPAPPQQPERFEDMSYWRQAQVGYQELVNAIIRPPRADYDDAHLGPKQFYFGKEKFQRTDLELQNERGLRFVCSHWEPLKRRATELPCVIYMHGNSSARVEAIPQLSLCLALGATMFAFDFSGSGRSDGEYVSLGFFEREDLKVVVDHLRNSGRVSTIALWGRSMGAATALLHGDRDPSIAAMILDSPFADLTMLAEEMVDKGRESGLTVPGFVVSLAIRWIRSSVQKQAGFNINELSPIAHADQCFIPALFVAGESDDFIKHHHSQQIHEKYAGDKNLVIVEGDHNSPRPRFLFDSVTIFLQTYLQIPADWSLADADPYNNGYPPWQSGMHGFMGSSVSRLDDVQMRMAGLDASFDDLNLGMTAERQHETQQALYNMLGGGGRVGNGNGNGNGNSPPADGPPAPEWACVMCTFINNGSSTACMACGTPKSASMGARSEGGEGSGGGGGGGGSGRTGGNSAGGRR